MTEEPFATRSIRNAGMTWTSFDRFGRYGLVSELLADRLGDEAGVLVDVGDASGYLRRFVPDRPSMAVDLRPTAEPFGDVRFVRADGAALPFAAGSALALVSCDALEHVPAQERGRFLDELMRVARRAIVLTAPFDTAGVRHVENLVARFAKVLLGVDQAELTEHAEHGLPDLTSTATALAERGWDVEIIGEGNLHDWLGMMVLRFSNNAHETTSPLGDGVDMFYNGALWTRSSVGPFYRHVVVATPSDATVGRIVGLEQALVAPDGTLDALAASFLGQLGLMSTSTAFRRVEHTLDQVERGIGPLPANGEPGIRDRIVGLEQSMVDIAGRLEAVHEQQRAIIDRLDRRTVRGRAGRLRRRLRGR